MDGPLDLRLNQEKGISAAERLDTISREELAGMLYENSDEPYCEELAKAITEEIRKGHRIDTTTKLRQVIEQTLSFLHNTAHPNFHITSRQVLLLKLYPVSRLH